MKQRLQNQSGQLSLYILIFGAIAILILSGFIVWADLNIKSVIRQADQSLALSIAEAGIEYYRWHLAHDPNDNQDGTAGPGPYEHEYFDKDGNLIGRFILDITVPPLGSDVVIVRSTGKIEKDPEVEKIIQARMAVPSLAKYAVIANDDMRFGPGTEIFGQVHSNQGIHFDGLAHNIIASARGTYNDPDHSGNIEYSVHTHIDPIDPPPPTSLPERLDVFSAGRQLEVPAIDFDGLTASLADIKTQAQNGDRYFADSGDEGYHLVLKTDDTFDLYRVTKIMKPPNGCVTVLGEQDWGTLTIETEELIQNYPNPANGFIFVEDDLWIDGQINSANLTIAAARFPENPGQYRSIIINKDIFYTNHDGQDIISLISQNNINVGLVSEDDLHIDAVLVAKNGRVGRFYYRPPLGGQQRCGPYHARQKISIWGMLVTYTRYGFAFTDGTGYQNRVIGYDPNLIFSPPMGFPTAGGTHKIITWEEIK